MALDSGDRQVRSFLSEMSARTYEERLRALQDLAGTDPELASQLTILMSRPGAYETPAPSPLPAALSPQIPSRFQIFDRLGHGGFGTVFQAFDRERQTLVALKMLQRMESDALYRFKQEFRSLTDLRHPNLIRFYDLFRHEDSWFFTMELVEGESILSYLRPGAQVHLERLHDTLRDLLSVTAYLHRNRIIHRDLKPSNILVDKTGRLIVLDFGLALHLGPGLHSGTLVVGTPAYMAPEQASNGKTTEAVDWYAIGVTLYQALTGKLPFEAVIPRMFLEKATSDPTPPAELAPDIPREWNEFCIRLLSRDPEVRASAAEQFLQSGAAETMAAAPVGALVGREDVLEVLFNACSRILAGKVSVIELSGPSGYGKTKILETFTSAIGDRFPKALIIRARCYEHESVPFKAVDEMMDQLSRELRRLGDEAGRYVPENFALLARLFPVLEQVKTADLDHYPNPDEIANPQEVRRRAFLTAANLFQKLSTERLIVICLDDLHWGDADSAVLFEYLLHAQPSVPLAVVASYRSDLALSPFLQIWRNGLRAAEYGIAVQQIEIGPLAPEAARRLATGLFGSSSNASADVIEALVDESRGEPLLLEQLVADFKRSGTQRRGVTVQQLVEGRVSRLSAPARGVLCTLAAAGEPLPESLVSRLTATEGERSQAISSLIAERLVRRRDVSGGAELEIYHDQIRAAVMGTVPQETVRALHLKIANGLAEIGFTDAGVIALHFAQANDSANASAYALKGARQAEAVFAFDRAARLYGIALERGNLTRQQRCDIYEQMADAYASANRLSDAAATYLQAAEITESVVRRAELRRRAGEELLRGGKLREGIDLLKSAGAEMRIRHTENTLLAVASILYYRAKLAIRGFSTKAMPPAEIPAEALRRLDLYWALTAGLSLGNPAVGTSAQLRYLDLALTTGDRRRIALGMAAQAGFLSLAGERAYTQSRELLQKAIETGSQLNDPLVTGTALAFDAACGYLMGRWNQANQSGEKAEQILREQCAGVSWQLNVARASRIGGLLLSGEWAVLSKLLAEIAQDAQSRGDLVSLATFQANQFLLTLALDDPERAAKDLRESESLFASAWSGGGVHSLTLIGLWARTIIANYSGKALSAKSEVDTILKRVKRSLLLRVETFNILTTTQEATFCVAAATDGSLSTADRNELLARARACADRLQKCRATWSLAQCQLVRGCIAAANSEPEQACIIWEEAERELVRNSMAMFAAAVRFWRGRLCRDSKLELSAEQAFRAQGVACPELMARALAPGVR